jgi:2-oxo-3-hexenedioate decarboxylase
MDERTIEAIAEELIDASERVAMLEPFSRRIAGFDSEAAYAVAGRLLARRCAAGWQPIGRKIGFTNRTIWRRYGVHGPIWAHIYDRTVQFAVGSAASVSLAGTSQPRLEPEIAVRFRDPPASSDPDAIADALDWIAPAFEVVDTHFPGWKFTAADTVADFSLHARLVVGSPITVRDHDRAALARALATTVVTLRKGERVVDTGVATNVLGGPLQALGHLVTMLRGRPGLAPLAAGEIVTTGTITDAQPVAPGETWRSVYDGIPLAGLAVRFGG